MFNSLAKHPQKLQWKLIATLALKLVIDTFSSSVNLLFYT